MKKNKYPKKMQENIKSRGSARLSFIVPQKISDLFDQTHGNTGGYKYKTLEAALTAFNKLPIMYQFKLKSGNEELINECLEKIEKLK